MERLLILSRINHFRKRSFLELSLKIKLLGIIVLGFLLLSISLIEYSYYTAKTKMIYQIEAQVKNTALNGWKEVSLSFEALKSGKKSEREVIEEISLRLSGPLQSIRFSLPEKSGWEEELASAIKILNLPLKIKKQTSLSQEISLALILSDNKEFSIEVKKNPNLPTLNVNINSNELIIPIYKSFQNLKRETRDLLISKYGMRIIRNIDQITNKIGNDGYIWSTQAIFPEWYLKNTKYPEDYSLEAIQKRFSSNFSEFILPVPLSEYLKSFGATPEEQFSFINNYMRRENSNPLPAYDHFHPSLSYVNTDNISNYEGEKVGREIAVRRNGIYYYSWKNPTDIAPRRKIVYMKLFEFENPENPKQEKIQWVICAGAYEDEAYLPITSLRQQLLLISFFITAFFLSLILFFFYSYFNNSLKAILSAVKKVNSGDLNVQVPIINKDEIGFLSESFNKMVLSVLDSRTKLEEYADSLEEKVNTRTKELKTSLDRIEKLKFFQDADYYLTAILLSPLGTNLSKSSEVNIEFFVRQKNEFTFKGSICALGGDICISRDLKLQGKDYTVFVNADAMGKSMQGAGGALVLGSVFEQIVTRFQMSKTLSDSYFAEKWLKHSFIDLHKVFESFNGVMYVTIVMGVIDNAYGTLYFMNADHPSPVLYRDKEASYIKAQVPLQKLGYKDIVNISPSLQVLQLKPQDIVIVGSDGKDDIWIRNEAGERWMNNDENFFLNIVKNSECNLPDIYEKISNLGKISDDFSLMKITYIGNKKKSENKSAYLGQEDRNELVKLLFEKKDFQHCAKIAKEFFEEFPAETKIAFVCAYCYFREGEYIQASQFSERVKIRDPFLLDNLFLLFSIYLKMGEKEQAKKQIQNILLIEPGNEKALKIQESNFQDINRDEEIDFHF